MSGQAKVVFPLPPPTTNSLTTQQRTQLLRKTKKLEQILGAAPHLLDMSTPEPVERVALSTMQKRRSSSMRQSRVSIDSFASTSTSSSSSTSSHLLSTPIERCSSLSFPQRSLSRSISTLRKPNPSPASYPSQHPPSYETWSESKPPFLSISLSDSNKYPDQISRSSSSPFPSLQRYTLSPSSPTSDPEDLQHLPFNIASIGSTRKSKMDRLRKKLGHGIPMNLVFPEPKGYPNNVSSSDEIDESPMTSFVFPIPRSPRPRRTPGTIAGSRDSLTEHVMIHLAPRSPSMTESDHPSTPLIIPNKPSSRSKFIRVRAATSSPPQSKAHLVAIIESPDEHGWGCAE